MVPVVVAFGANMGEREATLGLAVRRLGEIGRVVAVSALYRSAPMYVTEQPEFLNGVALLGIDLPPRALLAELKRVEAELGRRPRIPNGPREIDLDLVLYGSIAYRFGEALVVPHPRVSERRFVLAPLCEVWPEAVLVGVGPVADLLAAPSVQAQRCEVAGRLSVAA